ncbi:MAG: membrane protease YdiL (CAAX protease family) [Olleya marilimosa]|jgi:membrane protease YdiL (CAAX protease family)|uniref:CPBP family intramembrane glutamic endopeptidase n=1 Tax=Olleya marilimosa TaxID=272164 RepID=UPI0030EE1C68|tara:strand:- start:224414 stop:225370 length:957 start_codon:yes stop_codon:yes gene_type:complete
MDFIKQAFNVKHEFWRYLVGSLIIAIFAIVGQFPFAIAAMFKYVANGGSINDMDEQALMSVLEPNLNLFLLLLSFAFGFIGLIIAVKYLHGQTIQSVTTARKKTDWKRVLFAFLFWGIITSGMILVDYFISPESYVWNFELNRFLILVLVAVLLIPIQTSLEEYIFRGYLMQGFGMLAKNRWFPLLMTSVIFGGMHVFNPEVGKLGYGVMVYYIGTGLFLGILTLMDDGMELALGFHAANNLFGALLVSADWTVLQTHSVLKDVSEPGQGFGDIFIPVFVVFPILLIIFAKVYKWTNWKEKLFGTIEAPVTENYKVLD